MISVSLVISSGLLRIIWGEVGIGAWEYKDYAPRFDGGCGWVSAGSGRIDLTGKPLGEMAI